MQGRISKSSYTSKQQKEFLRTWTAIGRAHVYASHGPDLFQLLDIASSSLAVDNVCDDCGELYTAHPSLAGSQLEFGRPTALAVPVPAAESTLCTPSSTVAMSTPKPDSTSTSVSDSSGLHGKKRGKRQAGQASGLFGPSLFGGAPATPAPPPSGGFNLFGGFASAAPAPPATGNILFGSKPASDAVSTHNASSTLGGDPKSLPRA
jgi:hypothetical protein